jgi:L-erythro-3,5-diaminohexanoate dehydrogenase
VDPYGLRRVVSPRGVLPQRADVLDPTLPLGEDELSIAVEALNVDAASFRQIESSVGRDPERIGAEVLAIVRRRGKMHNPVTGSGGMLIGRVKEVGPRHPAAGTLRPGDRVATLVSLTLTPLRLGAVRAVRPEIDRVECEGEAVLFATGLWARLPDDLPETLALAALDVCGAPALVARLARPGQRVLVLGAGKSGALVCAQAKESLRGQGEVVAADRSEAALAALTGIGVCDRTVALDATDAVGALGRLSAAGAAFDLVVNCASVAGTEMASILPVKDGGTVLFFSMATSFTAAALGAEGVGKDATLLVGNGYVPGHADLTLGLLRRNPRLRALFEQKYARSP